MTPQEYLSWLDKEIESCRYILHKATCEETALIETEGRKFGLEIAKEKFLTIITDTQPTEQQH